MRILAFSDLHCDRDAATEIVHSSADADIVVGAGDFGIRGERCIELFEILTEISVPFIVVSGNHDRRTELSTYCDNKEDIYFLDGSSQHIHGVTFFGLGGEIPSRSDADWNESIEEDAATSLLADTDSYQVLVTHTPPYGYCDLQKNGSQEGSHAIANAIRLRAPLLCLCGHIHHSWGCIDQLEKTTVHNLGPKPHWHTIPDVM